jgi:hypothetical protein
MNEVRVFTERSGSDVSVVVESGPDEEMHCCRVIMHPAQVPLVCEWLMAAATDASGAGAVVRAGDDDGGVG